MVSLVDKLMIDYVGLSTDTKPSGNLHNGSSFLEMDTGRTFYYDEDGGSWVAFD